MAASVSKAIQQIDQQIADLQRVRSLLVSVDSDGGSSDAPKKPRKARKARGLPQTTGE